MAMIRFNTHQDVRALIKSLEQLEYLTIKKENGKWSVLANVDELAKEFIIDTKGETHFLPAILRLSENEATRSKVKFKTQTGETLTLHQVWQAVDFNALSLIDNRPLAEVLLTVTSCDNTFLLNLALPKPHSNAVLFTDPTIPHQGKTYNYHIIHHALDEARRGHEPTQFNEESSLVQNKVLADLIEIDFDQCLMRYRKLRAIKEKNESTLDNDIEFNRLCEKLKAYQRAFDEQDHYWQATLLELKNEHTLAWRAMQNNIAVYHREGTIRSCMLLMSKTDEALLEHEQQVQQELAAIDSNNNSPIAVRMHNFFEKPRRISIYHALAGGATALLATAFVLGLVAIMIVSLPLTFVCIGLGIVGLAAYVAVPILAGMMLLCSKKATQHQERRRDLENQLQDITTVRGELKRSEKRAQAISAMQFKYDHTTKRIAEIKANMKDAKEANTEASKSPSQAAMLDYQRRNARSCVISSNSSLWNASLSKSGKAEHCQARYNDHIQTRPNLVRFEA